MFPVAVMAGAGWLFLFVVLLIVPPSPGPHEGGGQGEGRTARGGRTRTPEPGDVPPAVVSLLARRLDRSGFGATLVDLAARGWFEVRAPAGAAGSARPEGPALCVVPAETPGGPLTPFERRVVAHVALRAGARGEVPAPALSDGFGGGETGFMSAFREEVDAEARRLGLTRSRLSGRRIGLLLLLLFVPAGALIPVAAHGRGLAYAGGLYFAGLWVAVGVGVSRRRSASGQAVLDHWRPAVAAPPGSDRRVVAAYRQARTRRGGRLPGQPGRRGDGLRADRADQHPRLGTHRVRGIAGRAAARRGRTAPRASQKD